MSDIDPVLRDKEEIVVEKDDVVLTLKDLIHSYHELIVALNNIITKVEKESRRKDETVFSLKDINALFWTLTQNHLTLASSTNRVLKAVDQDDTKFTKLLVDTIEQAYRNLPKENS